MTCAKRLIDANAFFDKLKKLAELMRQGEIGEIDLNLLIASTPTVDAVEVVRCKACDWYRKDGSICVNPKCGKSWYGCRVPEQHYCSYGERKDNGC